MLCVSGFVLYFRWVPLRNLWNQCVYTHAHSTHKHKEICNHVLKGKKSSKGLNLNKW